LKNKPGGKILDFSTQLTQCNQQVDESIIHGNSNSGFANFHSELPDSSRKEAINHQMEENDYTNANLATTFSSGKNFQDFIENSSNSL